MPKSEAVETEVASHVTSQRCQHFIEIIETEVAVFETPVEDVEVPVDLLKAE